MYVAIVGSIVEGCDFCGPFVTPREAQEAMELEEQSRQAVVRRRKRQKTALWMVTILPNPIGIYR